MKNSRNEKHVIERLKDRWDYRNALIQRREEIEAKIAKVEKQIADLRSQEKKAVA